MNVPNFLKYEDGKLLYNNDDGSEFAFYIPENFFNDNTKTPIASVEGEYVSSIGLFSWAIINKNGVRGKAKLFNFPTMILTRPYSIEKVKGIQLNENEDPDDYRVLRYKYGDEVISQTIVPQILNNVELVIKLAVITSKIPKSISYDDGWKIFLESARLNGFSYKLSAQLFGILWSELCRDPKDISKPFRLSDSKNMHGYKAVGIKLLPNYVSPYTSIVSEGFDEGIIAANLLSDKPDNELLKSPLEKIIMQ